MAHRLAGPGDIGGDGAGEAGDHRVLDLLGDGDDGLEIAVGGDREAGLDDVDAHLVERFGDLQLFLERHRGAGALLAVAQRGVENEDAVFVGLVGCRWSFRSSYQRPGSNASRPDNCCSAHCAIP